MLSLPSQAALSKKKLTGFFCKELSTPFCEALEIPPPSIHIWSPSGLSTSLSKENFGMTTVIGSKPHVFISPELNRNIETLTGTLAHEIIHCWQFTSKTHYNGEEFDIEKAELQAYSLESLAAAALAASFLAKQGKEKASFKTGEASLEN